MASLLGAPAHDAVGRDVGEQEERRAAAGGAFLDGLGEVGAGDFVLAPDGALGPVEAGGEFFEPGVLREKLVEGGVFAFDGAEGRVF